MKAFVLLCLMAAALGATIVEPEDCTAFPCLIFDEEFDTLDLDVWEHEITQAGGGNFEFQTYVNNRSISYVRDSTLFIKPALLVDWLGDEFLTSGNLNLWGSQGRNEVCTGNFINGCERTGTETNINQPIVSGRLRTVDSFAVRYGRIEVRAKTPRGDWLWPAVWMLPQNWPYGVWPASGEIDIIESRGNDDFGALSNNVALSTLHWGPYAALNSYYRTTQSYNTADGSAFPDGFHTWALEWTDSNMTYYLDDEMVYVIDPGTSFWDYGEFDSIGDLDNLWQSGNKMAPFDQKFYFLINLAVGGTGGFFPDGISDNKPWTDSDATAPLNFWEDRTNWLPTWQQGEAKISEGAALQVDYIRVYKMQNTDM